MAETYTDCSPSSTIGYIKNRPCDTYVLLADRLPVAAREVLLAENAVLRDHGWREVPKANGWGFGPRTNGWIAPHGTGCAIVLTARTGAREQARDEKAVEVPDGHGEFLAAARAASTSATLYALLQPGTDYVGRPRC